MCGRVSTGRRPPLSSGQHQPCLPMLLVFRPNVCDPGENEHVLGINL